MYAPAAASGSIKFLLANGGITNIFANNPIGSERDAPRRNSVLSVANYPIPSSFFGNYSSLNPTSSSNSTSLNSLDQSGPVFGTLGTPSIFQMAYNGSNTAGMNASPGDINFENALFSPDAGLSQIGNQTIFSIGKGLSLSSTNQYLQNIGGNAGNVVQAEQDLAAAFLSNPIS